MYLESDKANQRQMKASVGKHYFLEIEQGGGGVWQERWKRVKAGKVQKKGEE